MNEAAEILVVFLSVALAIFLILGIVVLSMTIKLLKSLQRISEKAEEMSEIIEESVRSFTNMKAISSLITLFNKFSTNKRSGRYGKKY